MKQPQRRKKKIREHIQGTGKGVDFCDECPFLDFDNGVPFCSANDVNLNTDNNGFVPVPDWCGNKKNEQK